MMNDEELTETAALETETDLPQVDENEPLEEGRTARIEQQKKDLEEARKALAHDPRNVALLNKVGLVAEAVGDFDRAKWAYKRAVRLDPLVADSYLNLGLLSMSQGNKRQAIQSFKDCLTYSSDEDQREIAMVSLEEIYAQDEDQRPKKRDDGASVVALTKSWADLKLSPAEALMILDIENSSGREMMRYTLLDMAIRGVLDVTEDYQVGRGRKFGNTRLSSHEAVFAKYFTHFSDYIDLDRLTGATLEELGDRVDLFKVSFVRQDLVEKGYLQVETKKRFGLIPITSYSLTEKGRRTRRELRRLLKNTDKEIAKTIQSDPDRAKAYLEGGGPAILLIDQNPSTSFAEWQETLERMGFGPALEQVRTKAQTSSSSEIIDEILKALFGE